MNFLIMLKIIVFVFIFYRPFYLLENPIILKDKISVIIPTYNRGNSVIKSINSILMQTYQNLEIIVIDDCSIDDTESLISELNDNRIKYIKLKENKGANFARNIGINLATGKYFNYVHILH